MSELMAEAQLRDALGSLKANIAGAVAKTPAHQAFLDQYLA
jgi:hypothetical protein